MFNSLSGRILSICPFEPVLNERGSLLVQQGYQVVSCEDPAKAQPLAMVERFSLVIVGHGYDVREIREMICWIRHKGVPYYSSTKGVRPALRWMHSCLVFTSQSS